MSEAPDTTYIKTDDGAVIIIKHARRSTLNEPSGQYLAVSMPRPEFVLSRGDARRFAAALLEVSDLWE